jgi:hypothetical protein
VKQLSAAQDKGVRTAGTEWLRWSSWHKTPECGRLNSWQRVRIIEVEELAKGQNETDGLADTVMKLVPFAGVNIKGFPRDKSPPRPVTGDCQG